ncbi:glycoside hydrolase family 97 catalytic domain-containing protein [Amycolatopsis sp. 195334CR]|uniref:glycoside hydrolase family 97 catalytic domain-containing protein n=1 Tax=Amycolatopsis sp. 195334CR TaxID=2814588 RepID=UPI001A8EE827|nr:glycoside hydrolase family 97 catalytic domain-containing protein [Amycolatopsis sp. 195334CR]MBN6040643.1 glycoside hydrolase family 97 catalytic domain-containing protein [Amycolatopsis sp. 195334CR]
MTWPGRSHAALLLSLAVLFSLSTVPAAAASSWTITGPSARSPVTAELTLDAGELKLSAARAGRTVLAPAPLGLRTEGADLSRDLRVLGHQQRILAERYTMTTGKRHERAVRARETRFQLAAGDARFDLLVRVSDDGLAYRYLLPEQAVVTGEASAYRLDPAATAWLLPYNSYYENQRVETTAAGAAAGEFGHPSLFRTGEDFALLTESDVDGSYSGSRLVHQAGSPEYAVKLADARVPASRTPWRTAIIGDLATVTESTLVDDLAAPSRIADTSWIRPGKSAWSWLSEHQSPRDFERQKVYVDFAARNGWPYVLVDEGWSEDWVPELTRYARARGVEVLLWFHWQTLDTPEKRAEILPKVKAWGVKGVKVDFMESDTQARYQWYDAILADTAALELMINFHGSTIPHGLARTWPHLMTMEAIHGQEQLPQPANNPVHPFTRNVVGSMDFTPVALEVGPRTSSVGHEVALPVLYESAWQHFADKPEAYDRHPNALRFLNQVPTVWDETRYLGGYPGDEAALARRDGDRWFVGAITVGPARRVSTPLTFLGAGDWLVETVRDVPGSVDVQRESRVVRSADTLAYDVPSNGGFAAIACPADGRATCDEPIQQVPATSLTISPADAGDRVPGSSFEVSAEFELASDRVVRDVVLAPVVPEGWSLAGEPVRDNEFTPGEVLSGRWTVTVGPAVGKHEVPIAADFVDPSLSAPEVHVAKAVSVFVPPPVPSDGAWVSDLPFAGVTNGWGPVERDRSNNDQAAGDGNPMRIGGVTYEKGLGTHAPSEVTVYLGRGCQWFSALAGLDDETTEPGSAAFEVLGDGVLLAATPVLRGGSPAVAVTADVRGVRMLTLRTTDGGDGKNHDHTDWVTPRLTCAP